MARARSTSGPRPGCRTSRARRPVHRRRYRPALGERLPGDTRIHIAWSASLADRHPELVGLLESIEIDPQDVNRWSSEIVNGRDPAEVTGEWVKANPDVIAAWMAE